MNNNDIQKEVYIMANMDYIERDYFEQLFNMGSGYVLDFTNRTFQEFVYEKIQVDVYSRYERLSKAKMLRCIMSDYSDVVVGKLLLELMRYMQAKGMVTDKNSVTFTPLYNFIHNNQRTKALISEPLQKHLILL